MAETFKVGDCIRCIDDSPLDCGELQLGSVHKVKDIQVCKGDTWVRLDPIPYPDPTDWWYPPDRFCFHKTEAALNEKAIDILKFKWGLADV